MALNLLGDAEPPEFSILEFVDKVKEELVLEGRSPLHYFDLDMVHTSVPGIWRPSGLRRCMRKQVYKAARVPKGVAQYDALRQHYFDRGHIFGAWVAAYIAALQGRYGFELVEREVVLHDDETRVGGKADAVLVRNGVRYVVEVKSKENAAVMHDIKPNAIDLAQLNDYMAMSGARAGWLVYFGVDYVDLVSNTRRKSKPRTIIAAKEFFHRFSGSIWDDTHKKVQLLSWFLQDQSKLAPKTANPYLECPNCEWRELCDLEVSPLVAKSGEG
jgi:hypothetical protein